MNKIFIESFTRYCCRVRLLVCSFAIGVATLAFPLVALGASITYANAPMGGPGGVWRYPAANASTGWVFPTINHNRMSASVPANHGVGVSVCISSEPSCRPFTYTLVFIQISREGAGGWSYSPAIAFCRNEWNKITTGYCALYHD